MSTAMMKVVFLLLVTALAFGIEPIVGAEIPSETLRPAVLLLPLIVAVLLAPGAFAVVWGGLVGLCFDCLSGPTIGPRMAAFAIVAAAGTLLPLRRKTPARVAAISFCLPRRARSPRGQSSGRSKGRRSPTPQPCAIAGTSLATALVTGLVCLAAARLARPFQSGQSDLQHVGTFGWQRGAD